MLYVTLLAFCLLILPNCHGTVSLISVAVVFILLLKGKEYYSVTNSCRNIEFCVLHCIERLIKCEKYCILFLKFVLVLTFGAIYVGQVIVTDYTFEDLIENTMITEEYKQSHNAFVYTIGEHVDMLVNLIESKIYRGDMPVLDYEGIMNGRINVSQHVNQTDAYFSNLMDSFTSSDGEFIPYGFYVATPNGSIYGMWRYYEEGDDVDYNMTVWRRDETTDWETVFYITDKKGYTIKEYDSDLTYDPRCRIWYRNTLKYGFTGNIFSAFPISDDDFEYFFKDNGSPGDTMDCVAAWEVYNDIFYNDTDIETITNTSYNYFNDSDRYPITLESKSDIIWTRYLFFTNVIGLGASKCVLNQETGDLIGVILIDYTLNDFSNVLNQTVYDHVHVDTTQDIKDIAYVMEADEDHNSMFCSSSGNTTEWITQLNGLQCIHDGGTSVAYSAKEHPDTDVRLFSKLIFDVTGMENVPNISLDYDKTYIDNNTLSTAIRTPVDEPYVRAGRIIYGPGILDSQVGIDVFLVKIINVSDLISSVANAHTVTAVISLVVFAIVLLLDKKYLELKARDMDAMVDYNGETVLHEKETVVKRDYEDIAYDWFDIIIDSINVYWYEYIHSTFKLSESTSGLITMKEMKFFVLNHAKRILSYQNVGTNRMLLCDESCLAIQNKNLEFGDLKFYLTFKLDESKIYKICIESVIIGHVLSMFSEPHTQKILTQNPWGVDLALFVGTCIVIEWIDLLLWFYSRLNRFYARTEVQDSKYIDQCQSIQLGDHLRPNEMIWTWFWETKNDALRVFIGPGNVRFMWVCLTMIIITINYIQTVFARNGFFSYVLPITPFLLIVHNRNIYFAMKNTTVALIEGKDILILFLIMLVVTSILGMTLFQENENVDMDDYSLLSRAMMTSFLYTGM